MKEKQNKKKQCFHFSFIRFLGELFPNNNLGAIEETGTSEAEDGLFSFPSTMIKFPSPEFGKVKFGSEIYRI